MLDRRVVARLIALGCPVDATPSPSAANLIGLDVDPWALAVADVAVALAAWATLAFLVTRTAAGRTVRACADDRASARWLGIDLPRVETSAFVVSAVLAAVAAVVATPAIGVSAGSGTILAVTSFLAVSLGGIGSDRGAIFGALAVALAEAFTARYWSSDVKELVVMVLLVVVLIARPAMTGTRIRPHRRDSVR